MKKIFVLLMCALMLSLASCSSNGDSDFSVSSPETTTTTASQDKTEESTDSADVSGDEYPFATPIVPDGLSSDPESFQVSLDGSEFLKLRTRCGTTILRFYISLLITI